MKLPVAERFLRVLTAAAMLMAVVAPSRAEDLSFDGNGTVRILASDWAEYLGGDSTFVGANGGGRLFYRGGPGAGDGNYIHFNLARLQGLTMQSNASVTLQNTDARFGGGVDGSYIATANGAWTAAGGASLPGATAIGDAVNATGSYGSGTSISWGIGSSTFQGYVNNASSFNGLAVIGGAGSQMHFFDPLSPYLSVATDATMNGVVTVAGGNAWNSSNYSFTDGVLTINDAVAEGQSGAGAVTINSLGTVFVNGNYNKYWAIDSTRINTGGVLFGYGHSNLNNLTLAGGELAGIRPDGTYGTWAFNSATTVTGGVTSTISAQQVIFTNGSINIDAGSTLNFTGSVLAGNISPTIAAGGKLTKGAGAGTSLGLGNVTLTGGELAATAQPNAAYGNYQLNGSVTVGGSTTSTISADIRMGADRTFDVSDVDGGSGVDLLVSGVIGHNNGVAWGYVTKTGAGTMKVTGVNGLGGMTVSAGRLVLEDAGIGDLQSTGLTNNAALEYGVTTGSRTTGASIGGSGSLTKTGAGTLVLTAESSYTGGTIVDAGVLSVAGGSGRGRIRGALTVNANGTVDITGDGSGLGYQDQISAVAINGGTITSAGAQHIWNISGGITMTGGTLQSNNGVSDPNGPQLAWNRTSVITIASASSAVIGGRVWMRADNGYSGISFNVEDGAAASDLLVSAAVTEASGGMGITKSGAGTMALTGVNSYSGVTTLSGGVVNAATFANNGTTSSLGVGTGDTDGNSIGLLFRGGTLQYTGSTAQSTNRSIRVSTEGGGATIDASGSNPDATLTFSAASSTNFLENPGNRTVTFTGNNTGNNTFAMAIIEVGSTAVVKSGAGTWVLSGNSSYTGGTTINGGVLRVGSGSALGAAGSAVTVSAGAGLDVNNQQLAYNPTISGQINATTGAIFTSGDLYTSGPAAITLGGNASIGNDGGRFDVGRAGGSSSQGNGYVLTKVGNNLIAVLASGSGFAGVVINGGALQLENAAALGDAPFTINDGGALTTWYGLTMANQLTINSGGVVRQGNGWSDTYSGPVTLGGAAVVDASNGSITISGVIGGTGSLSKTGDGTTTLSGGNSYSGGTTLNAGRLVAGSTGAFGSGSVTIAGGTLDLGGLAIANTIVNNGGSVVNAAAYAGSQSVAGTTVFTGTVGGTVTVDAGGTLKGSDTTFTGPVSIGDGGVHSPGTSPGSQTFASGLAYSGSSSLTWELIANTTSGPGTNYDFISVTGGDLTIASGASLSLEFLNTGVASSTVDWADSFWDVGRTWTLIDFTSSGSSTGIFTLVGSPSTWLDSGSTSLATARPSASFSVANQGGDVVLTYAIVPEPGSIALVGIGVGLAAIAVRRRRSA